MIDYFSYNGKGVLPRYSPGIPGYGQKGAPGNTGETGASVYYSSFKLSNETERLAAENKLNSGKSLSNNILYNDNNVIVYKEGDIALDVEGNFYEIEEVDGKLGFKISTEASEVPQVNINTNSSLSIRDFVVSCITSFKIKKTEVDPDLMNEPEADPETGEIEYPDYDDDTYSWKIENPYYINLSTSNDAEAIYSKSPYIAHKNYYSKYLYGNHIKFTIVNKEPLENCMFKYVLVFPSGEILSLTTDTMSGILFVDNSFIYDNIGGTVPFSSYMYKVDEESEPQPVKDLIVSLGEDSRHISIAASEYIKEYCKAYVEITNISNNTTYRVDVDDLFFRGKTLVDISEDDEYSDDSRVDHIIPGKLKTEWKFVEYICGNDYHPRAVDSNNEYVKYIDNNFVAQSVGNGSFNPEDCSPTFIRSFNQFNKFSFNKINCNYSKDGYEIKSTYAFDRYTDDSHYSYVPKKDSKDNLALTNNTIRLYFNKVNTFTLIIKYNPINKEEIKTNPDTAPIYPSSNVYIGIPNIPLIKWSDESDSNIDNLVDNSWTVDYAVTPGIIYLNKIVPIANPNDNSTYTKELDAGIAQVIINTDNYSTIVDKSKTNFIEIGVISTEDDGSEGSSVKHCSDYDISLYIFSMNDSPQEIVVDNNTEGGDAPIAVNIGEFIPAPKFNS